MIRVLLADDQAMVRSGLRMILEAEGDIRVVGEAGSGAQAIESVVRDRPDLVLMDIQMPGTDGIEATRRIRHDRPGGQAPRVLVLTTFDLDQYVFEALRAGASGFLLKNAPADELVRAVRLVARGESLLDPAVTRRVVEAYAARQPAPASARAVERLSAREREVLVLVAEGLTNPEIADRLVLGEATVKTHVGSILAKLGLRDRVAAVILAFEAGLVERSA